MGNIIQVQGKKTLVKTRVHFTNASACFEKTFYLSSLVFFLTLYVPRLILMELAQKILSAHACLATFMVYPTKLLYPIYLVPGR